MINILVSEILEILLPYILSSVYFYLTVITFNINNFANNTFNCNFEF